GTIFRPQQAWWFLGERAVPGTPANAQGRRRPPMWLTRVTHPLIMALALALSALLWLTRRRRAAGRLDALLLLALLLHLRCVLDTWNCSYYAVPFLLALVTWEGLARRRPPVLSLLATVAVWTSWQELPLHGVSPDG